MSGHKKNSDLTSLDEPWGCVCVCVCVCVWWPNNHDTQTNMFSVKAAITISIVENPQFYKNDKNNPWLIALSSLWGPHKHRGGTWMGQVLSQRDQYLECWAVWTGADAAALHCFSLWDSESMAGRVNSVYSIWGHINPITTNVVVTVIIEAGAFPRQLHLRSVEQTCAHKHTHFPFNAHS